MKNLGYTYVSDPADLGDAGGRKILGLFANEEMFEQNPEGEGGIYAPEPTLPTMTKKAINFFSKDPDGFFHFTEDSVDEMAHKDNARLMLESGRAMDKTVAEAEFYADGNGQTLLITTADHGTGGLTVESNDDPEYPDESGGEQGTRTPTSPSRTDRSGPPTQTTR